MATVFGATTHHHSSLHEEHELAVPALHARAEEASFPAHDSAHVQGSDDMCLMEEDNKPKTWQSPAASDIICHGKLALWFPPLRVMGQLLRRFNPDIRSINPLGGSIRGTWFLTPEQHVLEFFVVNSLFLGLLIFFSIDLASHTPTSTPAQPTGTIFLYVLAGLLSLSFIYAIIYKVRTRTLVFLLQPCHVVTTVELFVLFCPHGSFMDMTVVFNLMLYWIWNPVVAVLQPDLRDYKYFPDLFNFWFQHVLIIFIPFYILFSRQYDFFHWSFESLVVSFNLQVLYHFFLLEVVNLFAGTNLNYMMSPPPGPLEWFGPWYRVAMTCVSLALTVIQRLVLIDAAYRLFGDSLYDLMSHYLP